MLPVLYKLAGRRPKGEAREEQAIAKDRLASQHNRLNLVARERMRPTFHELEANDRNVK